MATHHYLTWQTAKIVQSNTKCVQYNGNDDDVAGEYIDEILPTTFLLHVIIGMV